MDHRKETELAYYDRKAGERRNASEEDFARWGAAAVDEHLRAPYSRFEQLVRAAIAPGDVVLELGAGSGVHSIEPARLGATVFATDISAPALAVAKLRAQQAHVPLLLSVADAECLPVRNGSVDVITSAGVLYCLDMQALLPELTRVLTPRGMLIAVDSFNHNPLYRLNRFIGRLRGRRTRRATTHIPTTATIALVREYFASVSVEYFGVWTFLWPLARRILGRGTALRLLNALEPPGVLRRYAFKIVITATGPLRR